MQCKHGSISKVDVMLFYLDKKLMSWNLAEIHQCVGDVVLDGLTGIVPEHLTEVKCGALSVGVPCLGGIHKEPESLGPCSFFPMAAWLLPKGDFHTIWKPLLLTWWHWASQIPSFLQTNIPWFSTSSMILKEQSTVLLTWWWAQYWARVAESILCSFQI